MSNGTQIECPSCGEEIYGTMISPIMDGSEDDLTCNHCGEAFTVTITMQPRKNS